MKNNTETKIERRGRPKTPRTLQPRRACIFKSDQPLLTAAALAAGVTEPIMIAHTIRHGLPIAARALSGQPQMEEAV